MGWVIHRISEPNSPADAKNKTNELEIAQMGIFGHTYAMKLLDIQIRTLIFFHKFVYFGNGKILELGDAAKV